MGRRRRDLTQSEWHHVINRGADRQDIFSADRDHRLFEVLRAESFERFDVELHAYVQMTNHFHLLTRSDGDDLSMAMQRLCSRYASAYNQRTERDGPLLTNRFHSVPILCDEQLAQTARYIHRNPLAFVPAPALASYRWSSLGVICGVRSPDPGLTRGVVDAGWSSVDYLDYVLSPQPADRLPMGGLDPLQSTSCDDIEAAIAIVASLSAMELRETNRRVDDARTLAVTLAVELRAAELSDIAERYGLESVQSVRRSARRGRVLATDRPSFASFRRRVLDELCTVR